MLKFKRKFKFGVMKYCVSLKKSIVYTFSVLCAFVFSSVNVSAAELFFGSTGREVGVGQLVEFGVFLNSQGETINAVEGEIVFPIDMVELRQIRDANSIISAWIEKPTEDENIKGKIHFSGIVPGGYTGNKGLLFSFIAEAKKLGSITISSLNEQILLSDGQGTPAKLARAPITIYGTNTTSSLFLPPYDPDAPEIFTPTIGQDTNVFDGKYFIVFTTQDKGSGIKEYQVAEEHLWPWQKLFVHTPGFVTSESPYILKDQSLQSTIYIKAIDNDGNERIIEIPPAHLPWYEKYFIWCILFLVSVLFFGILKSLYGGKKKI